MMKKILSLGIILFCLGAILLCMVNSSNLNAQDDVAVQYGVSYSDPLIGAASSGDIKTVKMLLAQGAHLKSKDNTVGIALVMASYWGHLEVVKELIANGADVNSVAAVGKGEKMTPLMGASFVGNFEIVKELLSQGADANIKSENHNDWTALMWATHRSELKDSEVAEMVRELLNHKANPNAIDSHGRTALMDASAFGYVEIVRELIAHGADVNIKDKDGETALVQASDRDQMEIVKELIAHGADVNDKKYIETVLRREAALGHLAEVKKLLADGVNVNATYQTFGPTVLIGGPTALIRAADAGHVEVVKELLAHGADVNMKFHGTRGPTKALEVATVKGHLEVVKALLAKEKNASDLNAALRTASYWGHLDVVKELLAQGADANAVDQWDGTALTYAQKQKHDDIVQLLIKAGANKQAPGTKKGTG